MYHKYIGMSIQVGHFTQISHKDLYHNIYINIHIGGTSQLLYGRRPCKKMPPLNSYTFIYIKSVPFIVRGRGLAVRPDSLRG